MASTRGRQVVIPLTNKSGGAVIAGDVVIIDTSNNEAFTTTTTAGFTGGVGVVQESIANNGTGRVLLLGYAALVNTSASVTRGQYGTTHTVAKQAVGTASRGAGTFAQWLTGGTTPTARIFSPDLAAAAGNVASDAIWDAAGDLAVGSGADTAAKLPKGADGGVLAMGNGAVIWNAGTSFPGSKATNDRYFRTDLGLEFFWDGTRWLSLQIFSMVLGQMSDMVAGAGSTNAPTLVSRGGALVSLGDLWLIDWIQHTRIQSTNDGSNYWTLTLSKFTTAVSGTTITTFDTSAHTVGNMLTTKTAIGALIGTTNVALQVQAAKTGAPGAIVADTGVVRCRIVAT